LVDELLGGGVDIGVLAVGPAATAWVIGMSDAIGFVVPVEGTEDDNGAAAGSLLLIGSEMESVVDVLAFFRETSTSADIAATVDDDEDVSAAPEGRDPDVGADTDAELRCR